MTKVFVAAAAILACTAHFSFAQTSAVPWTTDLEAAKRQAAAENKLVLLHFWGTYCRPCANLDNFVFSNPAVGQLIDASFVPVKIDVEKQRKLTRQFGIRTIPHDVMITPAGDLVGNRASPNNSDGYMQMISGIAQAYQQTNPTTIKVANQIAAETPSPDTEKDFIPSDQSSVNREPVTMINASPPSLASPITTVASQMASERKFKSVNPDEWTLGQPGSAGFQATNNLPFQAGQSSPDNDRDSAVDLATNSNNATPVRIHGLAPRMESLPSTTIDQSQARQGEVVGESELPAPIEIDGNCPVTFYRTGRWIRGDRRWGCVHRGRLYFFASGEALEEFKRTPDVYSPVLAGFDPVTYTETGDLVDGTLNHCAVRSVDNQRLLFMFRSAENQAAFAANPQRYIDEVQSAMRYADSPTILR